MRIKKMYILYDGRANFESTEDCSVANTASSLDEVRNDKDWPGDYVWFEYDVHPISREKLINEKRLGQVGEI